MTPDADEPLRGRRGAQPRRRLDAKRPTGLVPARRGGGELVEDRRGGRGADRRRPDLRGTARHRARARPHVGARNHSRRCRGPAHDVDRRARAPRDDLRRIRPDRTPHRPRDLGSTLEHWTRLGPIQFAYEDALDTDLNLFPNKDTVWFPESIPGPGGVPCFGFIHRPMFDMLGPEATLPAGIADDRPSIWCPMYRSQRRSPTRAHLSTPSRP